MAGVQGGWRGALAEGQDAGRGLHETGTLGPTGGVWGQVLGRADDEGINRASKRHPPISLDRKCEHRYSPESPLSRAD